ncbi:GNAT family N-acetyltransferase [Sphingobium sp. AP49]|uniref:GNAT family N-acetyltransferase n=1 Tax=Sphingobium sp. AP49 TaxID=1144307 RepID=UPI000562E83B|nr:GNAT family N-acetyltransferase [Sphingobium sp. AP49]WHO37741.1 GNAT family N-acetyltransferase [Sphingobium sp. AP49]
MADLPITTDRLILRAWCKGNVVPLMAAVNTLITMAYLGGPQPRSYFVRLWLSMARHQEADGCCFWIIERRSDGAILGYLGVKRGGPVGTPIADKLILGWLLGEDFRGQGLVEEAAWAAIRWARKHFPGEKIFACTVPGNEPSDKLVMALRMRRRPELDYGEAGRALGDPLARHIVYEVDCWA